MNDHTLTNSRGYRCFGAALLAGTLLLPFTPRMAAAQPPPGSGPWNNDLVIAESADGRRFGEARRFVERGGVPSLIRDSKGRLIAAF